MEEEKAPRKKKRGRNALIVLGVLVVVGLILHWPTESGFTISRETTYVTGPLNPDGTINYVAALNEMMSKGVTPENNAAPLLIQALGPPALPEPIRQRQFELLGIEDLPEEGPYLVGIDEYMRGAGSAAASQTDDWEAVSDLLDKLAKTPWSAAQHPRVAAWLKANDKPLSILIDAAKRPRYYVPLLTESTPPCLVNTFVFPTLRVDYLFGRPLGVRAMLKLHGGDIGRARQDLLAIHRLARLLAQDYHLINHLLAARLEEIACEADVTLATSGKLTPEQARRHLGDLKKLRPLPDIQFALVDAERFLALDCMMMLYRGGNLDTLRNIGDHGSSGPAKLDLDWDHMLRTINHWYDRMAEAHKRPTDRQRREALQAVLEDFNSTLADQKRFAALKGFLARAGGQCTKPWLTQMVTNVLLTILMPVVTNAVSNQQIVTMRLELVKLSLALAAFRAEKDEFPEKLSELSPAYVKKVPADIFAEGPLVYKRVGKGYLLYSVGLNMKDDGGVEDEDTDKDDIVVRVE